MTTEKQSYFEKARDEWIYTQTYNDVPNIFQLQVSAMNWSRTQTQKEYEAKLAIAVGALEECELAIEALAITQKEIGMGFIGKHLVAPVTLKKLKEALAKIQGVKG